MPETLDLCEMMPTEIMIDILGGSVEGGANMAGASQAIDLSGGGIVAATYAGITLMTRAQHRYWNEIAGLINTGSTRIFVPLLTDAALEAGEDYSNLGDVLTAAALFATSLRIQTAGYEPFKGQWFSIDHGGTIQHRAYRIVTKTTETPGDPWTGTIGIRPPLRAAVAVAADKLRFDRPLCSMRLAPGESMPWSWSAPGIMGQGSVPFVEHF